MSSVPTNRVPAAKRRLGLVREAARLIAEGQAPDYQSAKRKALKNLGLPAQTPLPRNQDIEAALGEHQRLFGGRRQQHRLQAWRRAALDAMDELQVFKPRLAGALQGAAAVAGAPVCLHLFADTVEEVGLFLMERGIPFRHIEQRLDLGAGDRQRIPGFGLVAGGVAFELLVFSGPRRRRTPVCPQEGGAMQRLSARQLRQLLETGGESCPGSVPALGD